VQHRQGEQRFPERDATRWVTTRELVVMSTILGSGHCGWIEHWAGVKLLGQDSPAARQGSGWGASSRCNEVNVKAAQGFIVPLAPHWHGPRHAYLQGTRLLMNGP